MSLLSNNSSTNDSIGSVEMTTKSSQPLPQEWADYYHQTVKYLEEIKGLSKIQLYYIIYSNLLLIIELEIGKLSNERVKL